MVLTLAVDMEVDKAKVVDEETDKVVGELLDMVGEMMAGRLTMVEEVANCHWPMPKLFRLKSFPGLIPR